MRGEENMQTRDLDISPELPPHARRRGPRWFRSCSIRGITSACAEKRGLLNGKTSPERNYLRMRGEESALPAKTLTVSVVL